MLNIGPRANGDIPYEISQRMLEMGEWLNVNGESIYGAEAFDLNKDQHDWGKITCKANSNKNVTRICSFISGVDPSHRFLANTP